MRALGLILAPLVAGCWKVDAVDVAPDRVPFTPLVGAPDGWFVERFLLDPTRETRCPDGEPAAFFAVYPADRDPRNVDDAPARPVALVFHSGAFDHVPASAEDDPGTPADEGLLTLQEELGGTSRLTLTWASRRVFTALGQYSNLDRFETHAGAIAAALAEKGIAQLWPANCWGNLWHDRRGVVDNDFTTDRFYRDGRTAAEFTYRHALGPFPPSNPVALPMVVDTDRIFLVGLGDGSRAVTELLNAEGPYLPAAVVLDSPTDDYAKTYSSTSITAAGTREGLQRIFPGLSTAVGEVQESEILSMGSGRTVPEGRLPPRRGILVSPNDVVVPPGANDALLSGPFGDPSATLAPDAVWLPYSASPQHVLANADVTLAKAVADFLGGQLPAVPGDDIDTGLD